MIVTPRRIQTAKEYIDGDDDSSEHCSEFLQHIDGNWFDCVLLDLHLSGQADGFVVLDALRNPGTRPPIIMMTACDELGNAQRAARLSTTAYLLKPMDETTITGAINQAMVNPKG